jgi:hypothetical protein
MEVKLSQIINSLNMLIKDFDIMKAGQDQISGEANNVIPCKLSCIRKHNFIIIFMHRNPKWTGESTGGYHALLQSLTKRI